MLMFVCRRNVHIFSLLKISPACCREECAAAELAAEERRLAAEAAVAEALQVVFAVTIAALRMNIFPHHKVMASHLYGTLTMS